MTRPFDKHLDSDELDGLISLRTAGVTDSGQLSEQALGEARRHVESCQDCGQKVQMHKFVQSEISRLGAQSKVPLSPDCIADTEWLNVAAGLLPETKTRELLKHAAQCGHCGPLLRNAADTLSDEVTPNEEEVLASLSSTCSGWRRSMAKTLRGSVQDRQPHKQNASWWQGFFSWPRLGFALAGITAVIVAGWLGVRMLQPSSAQQLLAQAYTEHRTLEVRIPGAKYAPMRVDRSASGSNLDKAASLLKAEALIAENLSKNPNDPAWLEARARADLLDGNYESAIRSLQRALEVQPDSPQVLTDLGSAYFLRAESADRPIDYGNAIESLGKALAKSPDDPVALFNRALASERMFLYTQAVNDWEHYLRVDPSGEWAEDVRRRLAVLKQKVELHEKSQAESLLTPKEFVASVTSFRPEAVLRLDKRAEDYLNEAIQHWMPAAFPENQNSSAADLQAARVALALLAKVLATRHQDRWLTNLLGAPASSSFSTGVRYLSNAAKANAEGDPDATLLNARLAQKWLHKTGNQAAILWAELEEIFALHRQYHSAACLAAVARVEDEIRGKDYPWIRTQAKLERFACLGPKDSSYNSVSLLLGGARRAAAQANYGTVYLRALAFSASNETGSGFTEKAWEWDRTGLERYWSGLYPPLRAHHFYDDLTISAQDSEKWLLAIALGREAVSAIAASGNRTGEGMERIELARSASHAQLWQEGNQQYSEALAAFSSLPQNNSTRALRATAEIGLADVALSRNQTHDAEAHLKYVRANLPPDFDAERTWLSLYGSLAEFRKQEGDPSGAQRACEAAVLIAEMDLAEVRSELETLRWRQDSAGCYKELVESELIAHDETAALELWEWYQSAGTRLPPSAPHQISHFADLDQSPVLPSLHQVTADLSSLDRETVLVYAELGDQVHAWAYDNRGIYSQRLETSSGALNRASAKFATQCADPTSDLALVQASARSLYKLLIAPLAAHLDSNRSLVLEVDDALSMIPFAALVEPGGNYLVNSFRIVYLPSIGYRRLLRESTPITRQDEALVVASPAFSTKDQAAYAPLPDANIEAENVASEFTRALILRGKQATAAAVSQALPGAAIFHFAGHTRSQPAHNGLLLAPESDVPDADSSILSADDISSQALQRLRLAVLSACSTGRDERNAHASSVGLARVFLRAGVPSVIATRWSVDSAATAELMRMFYRETLSGKLAPYALAASMNQIRALVGYTHPYYWAAFDALGRGSESLRTTTVRHYSPVEN